MHDRRVYAGMILNIQEERTGHRLKITDEATFSGVFLGEEM